MGCVRSRTRSAAGVAASTRTRMSTSTSRIRRSAQAVWSSGTGGGATRSRSRPSMHKTQGVLSTIQILPSELPSVQAGRSPPVFAFKQKINRALKARLAAWAERGRCRFARPYRTSSPGGWKRIR